MTEGLRILVCGGREFSDRDLVFATLDRIATKRGISVMIHGAANGADRLAAEWASARGVRAMPFPADWFQYGKRAGPIRNRMMLTEGKPDGVVAFPGGKGTTDMKRAAKEAGVKVWEPVSA